MDFTIINDGDDDFEVKFTEIDKVYGVTDAPEEGDVVVIRAGDDHMFTNVDTVLSISKVDRDAGDDDEDGDDEDDDIDEDDEA